MAASIAVDKRDFTSPWRAMHTIIVLGCVVAIVLVGVLTPASQRFWAWISIVILLTAFAIVAGNGITGLWRGMLIDEQNTISLSRLQLALWTILILSGFLAAGLDNIHTSQPEPLMIHIPAEVWGLLGISTTSLVAVPLILNNQKTQPPQTPVFTTVGMAQPGQSATGQPPPPADTAPPAGPPATAAPLGQTFTAQRLDPTRTSIAGSIVVNNSPTYASWSDLFTGDQVGNAAHLDLAKIQLFYFTLVIVLAYAVGLGTIFHGTRPITEFPKLDPAVVALMGISHAGYLTNKVIPHPPSQ